MWVSEMARISAGVKLCKPLPARRCNKTLLESTSAEARCKSHRVSSLLHPGLKGCSSPQLPVSFPTVPQHSSGSPEIFLTLVAWSSPGLSYHGDTDKAVPSQGWGGTEPHGNMAERSPGQTKGCPLLLGDVAGPQYS